MKRSLLPLMFLLLGVGSDLKAAATIYLGTNYGPMKSTDGGVTFQQLIVEVSNPFIKKGDKSVNFGNSWTLLASINKAQLGEGQIVVPAHGHASAVLADLLPAIAGTRGTVRLTAAAPVFGLGIRANGWRSRH